MTEEAQNTPAPEAPKTETPALPPPPDPVAEKSKHLRQSLLLCGLLVCSATILLIWQSATGGLNRVGGALEQVARNIDKAFKPSTKSTTILRTSLGSLHKAGDLVVLKNDIFVEVESSESKELWGVSLGTTTSKARVPCRVQYVLPLGDIDAKDFSFDKSSGRLQVHIPKPTVDPEMIDVKVEELETETEVGWARTNTFSGERTREKAVQQLRPAALKMAEHELIRSRAEAEATEQVRSLLEPLTSKLREGVTLEVVYEEPKPKKPPRNSPIPTE